MRLGDHLCVEDHDALNAPRRRDFRKPTRAQKLTLWLIVIIVCVGMGLPGCDGEAAEITAHAEQEAHQRHVEAHLGWVKYYPTVTPIRASDLEASITVCHRLQDRLWECHAK